MVKLRRLKIERFRNVEPCDLTFSDGLNVVLGQNGAGKTTLLNFVSKVLRTNLADTSDPFAIEIELTFPGGSLSGRIATRESEPLPPGFERLEQTQGFRSALANEVGWTAVPEFEVSLQWDKPEMTVSMRRQKDVVEWERRSAGKIATGAVPVGLLGMHMGVIGYLLVISVQSVDTEALATATATYSSMEGAHRFDEGLDTYRAIVAQEEESSVLGADLRPTWRSFQWDAAKTRRFVAPGGLSSLQLTAHLRDQPALTDTTAVSLHHDQLTFLRHAVQLLSLDSAEAKLELIKKSATSQREFFDFGNLKFWFTRKDGSIFQDHQLSYGQKRLLTFLYYLDANPSFVIADELVNGMHHHWIEESVRAIGDRQAFLTSQNPLLLDYLTFESVEQVKSSFVVCRTELHDGRERMIWRNFTDDEADMFFRAYRVGIEHVGEILRTRGLW